MRPTQKGGLVSDPPVFEDEPTGDALSRFLKVNGIWVGLQGCLEFFDELAIQWPVATCKLALPRIGPYSNYVVSGDLSPHRTFEKTTRHLLVLLQDTSSV